MSTREEWLVVPLLLVVMAAAVGGHLFLRGAHERELDRYREHGRAELADWLGEEGRAHGFPEQWAGSARYQLLMKQMVGGRPMPPLRATIEGRTYGVLTEFDEARWQFTETYPAGVSAPALANDDVRMALEGGATQVSTKHVDDATHELLALVTTPDLSRLRKARLPIGTKQFLLRRWAAVHDETAPRLHALANALDLVRQVHEHSLAGARLGYHEIGELVVRKTGDDEPLQIAPRPMANRLFLTKANVARARGNNGIVLSFHATSPDKSVLPSGGPLLWHETTTDGPLAGSWTFRWDLEPGWWNNPRYSGRLLIGITGLLIILGGISLLWFGMRKQRKLNEARARFVNELAHDLRTPLTSLRLHTEMLESGRAPEARRGHYLGLIGREASRLSALLANLLDLSRLDGARAPLHLGAMSLKSATGDAVRAFALVHPDRASDVHLEGPSDAHVRADPAALARVLGNLLENAGKFTKPGTAIRVTWEPFASKWALRVADDGPGISPEERRAVFRRYGRGTKAKSDGVAGSGLGLALVRELTERMKGSVRLLPTTTGATFEIRLPGEAHA